MRVLALAVSDGDVDERGDFSRLILIGLVGIRDEVREEARAAVRQVHNAGIQVVMITGDNKDTAAAIAREAGLLSEKGRHSGAVITSAELAAMSDDEVKALLPKLRVVARALPSDKSRLVQLAQSMGLVAGMTGDGINDAPALKKADVGFAMGSGTEVAKEAGDIVILNDNFASIARCDPVRPHHLQEHPEIHHLPAHDEPVRGRRFHHRAVHRHRYAGDGGADAVDQHHYGYAGRSGVRRGTAARGIHERTAEKAG